MSNSTAQQIGVHRNTADVLTSHLGSFAHGLDAILADYDDSSVLITPDRTYTGLKEIKEFFGSFLQSATPEFWSAFKLHTNVVASTVGYITWSSAPFVALATDTIVVKDGRISVQTFTPFSQ